MMFTPFIQALALPADALLHQRVPKKLLMELGAPTAADKRQLQDGVDEMLWVAALKPTNIGVPAYRDDVREYLEIAVITAVFRASAKATRLIELIHRAIPYPVVLIAAQGGTVNLSLAHKRGSQGQAGKVVLDDIRRSAPLSLEAFDGPHAAFLASLALSTLPTRDLHALYQGWHDRLAALEAALLTGTFSLPNSQDRAAALRQNLDAYARLQRDLASLRIQAGKEKQLNRRVALNLKIKQLEAEIAQTLTLEGIRES